jgi:hypothetical protein
MVPRAEGLRGRTDQGARNPASLPHWITGAGIDFYAGGFTRIGFRGDGRPKRPVQWCEPEGRDQPRPRLSHHATFMKEASQFNARPRPMLKRSCRSGRRATGVGSVSVTHQPREVPRPRIQRLVVPIGSRFGVTPAARVAQLLQGPQDTPPPSRSVGEYLVLPSSPRTCLWSPVPPRTTGEKPRLGD